MKKVLITVGGTGGHIFPAVALASELKERGVDLLFVGGRLAENPYFSGHAYPHHSVACATIPASKPWMLPHSMWQISKGLMQSRTILQQYSPHLVVGFGSYYTLPVLVAARMSRFPYVLHEANNFPGKVNRLMSSRALYVATHFAQLPLKGSQKKVSMPLRPGLRKGAVSREQAAAYYGLNPAKKTLLVLGGSQGARAINEVVRHTAFPHYQVIHLTGDSALGSTQDRVVKKFESEMQYALSLADAAVCRAGANTIAELIEFEIPAVLIPFPAASENHQEFNARYFERVVQGGVVLLESKLSPETLTNHLSILSGCRRNIASYKETNRLDSFVDIIMATLENGLPT